ncbi:MAG: hypothetical protein ABR588_00200 [Sphingomicrobium sp.]|nr:hypothetical protein [Sphingomonadales bacterium]
MAQAFPTPDSLALVRGRIGERIAEIEQRAARMKQADICQRMDAIRAMAAEHGLVALEGLADYSAHHAMMPGHRTATRVALEHMVDALDSSSADDRQTILASIAVRLQ